MVVDGVRRDSSRASSCNIAVLGKLTLQAGSESKTPQEYRRQKCFFFVFLNVPIKITHNLMKEYYRVSFV